MPKVSDVKKATASSETDTKKDTKIVEVKETVQAAGSKAAETKAPAVKAAGKAPVAVKAEASKAEIKAVPVEETAAEAKKASASAKTEAPKAAPAEELKADTKKAPAKAETKTKKTAAKKEAAAKAPAEKPKAAAGSKKVKESLYIQYAGKELEISEIMEKAKDAYEGDLKSVKEFTVYVKPEENMAYFVVNGDETGSVSL